MNAHISKKLTIVSACMIGILSACSPSSNDTSIACLPSDQLGGFITIPSGTFTKSANPVYREEGKPRRMHVDGFRLQTHEVTQQQFADFVAATQYLTDAERGSLEQRAGAGSALFTRSSNSNEGKWELIDGLSWQQPEQQGKPITDRSNHPVVHISFNDARAYAEWAGGRLPTETEWEYAASLGIEDPNNPTSGAYDEQGKPIANTWQGIFPLIDAGQDGYKGTAPVGCYTPSSLGLYDMIGNVWEWTSTPFGPQRHTIKGGSHLCANNFCKRYRPGARQSMESDFSSNHIGFRIAKDLDQ